ncbi:hypothetical protein EV421DRAFT_1738673 [Armillaria borealis]|uniref:Uncharacterized protein n=1 Tax=Armillaria borealis TaxID=47425 RepID=A0AA39JCA2_9AGAR|nr:hypothetical protein EV421DRAFT_1738673 [Armillaria borealis]
MPQSIRGTLCESARKLGYVPVTRFEPQQGPEVANIDKPRLSPIWFAPPGPPCPPKDTDMQELPKTKIRITRYRQRGKPREECEVTQEEALANMLAGTSLTSGPSYEQGKSASSDFSPSLRGPEYGQRHDYICLETLIPDHLLTLSVPRCLSMDNTPTPKADSDLTQRSNAERGRKGIINLKFTTANSPDIHRRARDIDTGNWSLILPDHYSCHSESLMRPEMQEFSWLVHVFRFVIYLDSLVRLRANQGDLRWMKEIATIIWDPEIIFSTVAAWHNYKYYPPSVPARE